jgi:hypothetical protein
LYRIYSLLLFAAALLLVADRAAGLFVLAANPYTIASALVAGACIDWAIRRGTIGFVARTTMLILGLVLIGMCLSIYL